LKDYEFDRIISKFGFETRDSGDRLAWLIVDGVTVVKTKRSKGRGDLPFSHQIRQQLKLNEAQLRDAISCSLGRDGYLDILHGKGLL
jgi:hypothetical protein